MARGEGSKGEGPCFLHPSHAALTLASAVAPAGDEPFWAVERSCRIAHHAEHRDECGKSATGRGCGHSGAVRYHTADTGAVDHSADDLLHAHRHRALVCAHR